MKFRNIFLMFFIFISISCKSITSVVKYDNENRAPNYNKIDIFSIAKSVPYSFKEIGLIIVDDQGWDKSENELLCVCMVFIM